MFVDISQSYRFYCVGCRSMVCIVRWKYQILSRAGLASACFENVIWENIWSDWLFRDGDRDQEAGMNFTVFVYFLSKWQQQQHHCSADFVVCSSAQVSWHEILLLPLNSWLPRTCSTCSTRSRVSGSASLWRRSDGPRFDRSCTLSSASLRMASDSSKLSRSRPHRSHLNRGEIAVRKCRKYLISGYFLYPDTLHYRGEVWPFL